MGNEEPSSQGAFNSGYFSDSGLQLNLEIAQALSQRKSRPLNRFSAGRKCVEASDDVIRMILLPVPTTANGTLVQCV